MRPTAFLLVALVLSACGGADTSSPTSPATPPPTPVQRLLAASRDAVETFTVALSDGRLVPAARLTGVSPSGYMVASPDGARVYATTINGIEGFRVSADGAALTPLPGSPYPGTTRFSSLSFAPSGSVLYAQRPGEIVSLRVDAAGGLAAFSAMGASASPLVVAADGRFAYALAGQLLLGGFRIDANGAVAPLPGTPYPLPSSAVNPYGLRMGRAGRHLYFVSQGDGVRPPNLQVYAFDATSGLPEPVAQYATPGDAQPVGFELSRSGASYYVSYRDNATGDVFVQAYAVDGATGRLGALGRVPIGRAIFSNLRISSDQRSLFVTLEPASAEPPIPPTGIAVVTLGPAGELGAVTGPLQTATSFTHSLIALGPLSR